jgi:GDP-L-fucose synthase
VGTGTDLSILELAQLIAGIIGWDGTLVFDPSMPDGTPRKLLDVSRLRSLGWQPSIDLADGITSTYQAFLVENAGAYG